MMTTRVMIKAIALFLAATIAFGLFDPLPQLSRVSIYNTLVPGRERLPWGERQDLAYNLSLTNLDAMFASHEIAQPKAADEFRVVLIGDSATWGFLLKPGDTLSGRLNAMQLRRGGKRVRVYNLGYPDFSVTKDALLLRRALRYQPDLVLWLVTLRSLPNDAQAHALVDANCSEAASMTRATCIEPRDAVNQLAALPMRRRALADLIRLQLYGVIWAASGIDQHYPANYEPVQRDFERDESFREFKPPTLPREALSLPVLTNAVADLSGVPLIVVNEPMLISAGANSDVRYNFFYPRWAYDHYRVHLREAMSQTAGVRYLDLWDRVPQTEFTNSAVHLTPAGSQMLAGALAPELLR
jgi:hypothetical protein